MKNVSKTPDSEAKTLEKYKFYRLYDIDFEMALESLKLIKEFERLDIRYPLLRDTIVSYTRPFSPNKGHAIPKHRLPTKGVVPDQHLDLHNSLLKHRDEIFAHTDLVYKDPQVAVWEIGDKKHFPMSFRACHYEILNGMVNNIEELVLTAKNNLRLKIQAIEGNDLT